jgi:NADH:ubiquinone oxidoreductase subunit 5 (subunit L)/multisubunit Na+/H+ antiporter MnhA subunit
MIREIRVPGLLAYAGMSQVGLVLVGLSVGCWEAAHPAAAAGGGLTGGIAAAGFQLAASLLAMVGLGAVLAYLTRRDRPLVYLDDLAGLVRSEPLAAGCALVFLLSLAGMPPFPGFWGRLLIVGSAFSVTTGPEAPGPDRGFVMLAGVALLSTLSTAAVYFRIVRILFFEPQAGRQRPAGGRAALAAGVLAAVLTVGAGLFPGQALRAIVRAFPQQSAAKSRLLEPRRGQAVEKRQSAVLAVDLRAERLRADPQRFEQTSRREPALELEFGSAMRAVDAGGDRGHTGSARLKMGRRQSRERLPERGSISTATRTDNCRLPKPQDGRDSRHPL